MAKLIIVSNRVGVPDNRDAIRAGGLEVAVRAALKRKPGVWFGWSGKVTARQETGTRTFKRGDTTYEVTDLAKADHQEFYNGFANRVLWPIFHYRLDLAEFQRRDLSGYLRVNEHFAQELHNILQPDDIVWVHDYHLIPLARALRERGHRNRIGFFLHIPCPPPEILTALPNHERLLPAMCDYDVVGFQTGDDALNFSRYLTRECGLHSRDFTFAVGERKMQVGVFPVGVETMVLARLAQRSEHLQFVREVRKSLGGRTLMIGIDRLDYSKGILQRVAAFERFLGDNPGWLGKVTYLQVAPQSRISIPEYADMGQQVSAAIGRVNGAFGEADWTPLRYVNRTYARSTLAGLCRSARVALVTPLRDGMNLVAKEYIAAQNPEDPGVLVLSRFAGAARECTAALLVNPHDPDSVSMAIARALSMPLDERRDRQAALFRTLAANDVDHWAAEFLAALTRPSETHSHFEPIYDPLEFELGQRGGAGIAAE